MSNIRELFFNNWKTMHRRKTFFLIGLFSLLALAAQAQEKSWAAKALKAVADYMDSSAVKGVDSRYIVAPKEPWAVVARYNLTEMRLKMKSYFGPIPEAPMQNFSMQVMERSGTGNILGFWIGYRGYGIGYSKDIGRGGGSLFTTGLTGGSYGLNLRLRTFKSQNPQGDVTGTDDEGTYMDLHGEMKLKEPIRVRSLYVDGYYLFNGKHFSYAAAYDQSVIQLRSAGSLMVGAMWQQTTVRYNDNRNALLVAVMHDVGVVKIRHGSLGVGYAYNWVPCRGLLVNAMAMPMLTLYNSQKMEFYDTYWGSPLTMDDDYLVYRSSATHRSDMTVLLNARMSLTYNWKRFFLNVHGQLNHFRYDQNEDGNGWITDWFVNTSLGVRF